MGTESHPTLDSGYINLTLLPHNGSQRLHIKMSTAVQKLSGQVVKMSRMSHLKGSHQVICEVQVPIVYSKKSDQAPENIVEKKVEIVTPLGPLPSKRWEMESKVKMPAVSLDLLDSIQK